MSIDTKRNYLWLIGGSNGICAGGVPPNTQPRRDMYYLRLNVNPLLDNWVQVTPAHLDVTNISILGAMAYDPDHDALFVFGSDGSAEKHDHYVYCRTAENPTPGLLTTSQASVGCSIPDDWNEVTLSDGTVNVDGTMVTLVSGTPFDGNMPKWINVNGDFYTVASVTDSRHLVLAGTAGTLTQVSYYIQPPGVWFPGMVYDNATKKMIQFGGSSSDAAQNQTWAYDMQAKSWRRKALGGIPPPANVTIGNVTNAPAMAYNTQTRKILYHQFSNSGAPADWQYDPVADTWTKLASSGGVTSQQVLAYDTGCNCLIGWSQSVSGGPDVWVGALGPSGMVTVSPTAATLGPGATQQFSASVPVTWTINPSIGTISTTGLYTAPAAISTAMAVTVTATSTADATKSATATVYLAPPVVVTVSPTAATLGPGATQQFIASVPVTWTINPSIGTISTTGLYTAPAAISAATTVTVTATSTADATKSATATVYLAPSVVVTVLPTAATLSPGATQQFIASVPVTWSINPIAGTISTTGLYTAPAVISAAATVTVTATSTADATKSATATVYLAPPVIVTVLPTTATLGPGATQQFIASVPVTWSINPSIGTISTTGLYTAPAAISATTVTVTAISTADATKSATATVYLAPPVVVTVLPTSATLGPGATQQFIASVPVTWSINPSAGTISTTGLYTAPAAISAAMTVTVTATSTADATKSATATVYLAPPVTVTVTPTTATLGPGAAQQFIANVPVTWSIYPSTGTISADGLYTAPAAISAASTVTVTATFVVDPGRFATATVSLTPPATVVTISGITNGASYSTGAVSPGEIITVFGSSIGPSPITTLQLTADGRVSTTLARTRILFDEVPAPLIYVRSDQSAAVVPYSVDGKTTTQLVVEYQGVRSAPITVPVTTTAPGIFTADSSGKGQGAILNQNSSVNGLSNPAAAESIVAIYATGEGQTTPPGSDGSVPTTRLPKPKQPYSVSIGGKNAEVLYIGAAPGFVAGVLQVNVKLPPGVTGSAVPVTINIGGINSQPGVTVAVQ